MQLEEDLDSISPDDIRVRGHRIGIETILLDYLNGASPEEICCRYRTLSLEEVFATITYYWHRQEEVDAYLKRHLAYCSAAEKRYYEHPRSEVIRLVEAQRRLQASLAPDAP